MPQDQDDSTPSVDPENLEQSGSDVGGPQAAIGTGTESALTGDDAKSGDEGRSGTNPKPTGV